MRQTSVTLRPQAIAALHHLLLKEITPKPCLPVKLPHKHNKQHFKSTTKDPRRPSDHTTQLPMKTSSLKSGSCTNCSWPCRLSCINFK